MKVMPCACAGLGGYSQSTVALLAAGIIGVALVSGGRGPPYETQQVPCLAMLAR